MPVLENLATPYYQQETDFYCGAACAKMVLEQIGAGALDQDDLYTDNHDHSVLDAGIDWFSAPDGVNWTMNHRKPPAFPNHFVLFSEGTEDAISRKIAWTIHHYRVAPIAVVYGWDHWVVVRGYEASAAPTSSADTSIVLYGVFINNPWPPVTFPSPGIEDEHIGYSHWVSTYMTGVPSTWPDDGTPTGSVWSGLFLAVCDPEPAALEVGRREAEAGQAKGSRLLSAKEMAPLAVRGLKRHGLFEQEQFARALDATKPGEGRLVQRLDRADSYYYLVPMMRDDRPRVVVSVDALDARYHQASIVAENGGWDLSSLDREAIRKLVVGQRLVVDKTRVRVPIRSEAVSIHPVLVWKPCRESLSPNYPFAMITVGQQRFYIRSDGQVFSELHDLECGL